MFSIHITKMFCNFGAISKDINYKMTMFDLPLSRIKEVNLMLILYFFGPYGPQNGYISKSGLMELVASGAVQGSLNLSFTYSRVLLV